jgi:hypothetical protein
MHIGFWWRIQKGEKQLRKSRCSRWEDKNIKINLGETGRGRMDWIWMGNGGRLL